MISDYPPSLAYTAEESQAANEEWQATCGHHALAAACGVDLDAIKNAFPKLVGYTSPSMLVTTLHNLGRPFTVESLSPTQPGTALERHRLIEGRNIIRVQWEGTWLNPGVPKAAAYKHTHWVTLHDGWVLDPMLNTTGWYRPEVWLPLVDSEIPRMHRVTGWHFTHAYRLTPPGRLTKPHTNSNPSTIPAESRTCG